MGASLDRKNRPSVMCSIWMLIMVREFITESRISAAAKVRNKHLSGTARRLLMAEAVLQVAKAEIIQRPSRRRA